MTAFLQLGDVRFEGPVAIKVDISDAKYELKIQKGKGADDGKTSGEGREVRGVKIGMRWVYDHASEDHGAAHVYVMDGLEKVSPHVGEQGGKPLDIAIDDPARLRVTAVRQILIENISLPSPDEGIASCEITAKSFVFVPDKPKDVTKAPDGKDQPKAGDPNPGIGKFVEPIKTAAPAGLVHP